VVIALVAVLLLLGGLWTATREVYFLGIDRSRGDVVTIYRGLPYDLPFGISLYSPVAGSGVTLRSVPATRRREFTDHQWRSRADAESLVRALELGALK
jgi:protein phosphatase